MVRVKLKWKLGMILGIASAQAAFAASPFTMSGNKVAAIFESERVWRFVAGPVLSISEVEASATATRYRVETREPNSLCVLEAEVENTGDEFVPTWSISKVSFGEGCGSPKSRP